MEHLRVRAEKLRGLAGTATVPSARWALLALARYHEDAAAEFARQPRSQSEPRVRAASTLSLSGDTP